MSEVEIEKGIFEKGIVVEGNKAHRLVAFVCALDLVQEGLVVCDAPCHFPPAYFGRPDHILQVVANRGQLADSSGVGFGFRLKLLEGSLKCLSPKTSQPGNNWLALRKAFDRFGEDGPVLEEFDCEGRTVVVVHLVPGSHNCPWGVCGARIVGCARAEDHH